MKVEEELKKDGREKERDSRREFVIHSIVNVVKGILRKEKV